MEMLQYNLEKMIILNGVQTELHDLLKRRGDDGQPVSNDGDGDSDNGNGASMIVVITAKVTMV